MDNACANSVSVITSTPSRAIRSFPAVAAVFLVPVDGDEYPLFLCGRATDPRAVQRASRLADLLSEMPGMFDGTIAPGYVAGRHVTWGKYSIAFITSDNAMPATYGKIVALMRSVSGQAPISTGLLCTLQDVMAATIAAF